MSMFEQRNTPKVVDDTEKLICTIESAHDVNNHTEYSIRVERSLSKIKWFVSHRYKDFTTLHVSLQKCDITIHLPPKKLIGNRQPAFVAQRQVKLQNYLNEVLKHPILSLSLPVRQFLDPSNYSLSLQEQTLQAVSLALRGDNDFVISNTMKDIGWRIKKQYFNVFCNTRSNSNYILSWQYYGPDKTINSNNTKHLCKSLLHLSHPYISKTHAVNFLDVGMYIIKDVYIGGTIRDHLYGCTYTDSYLSKYGNPQVRKPFTSGQLAHYGFQILNALKFLRDKGFPYGHLHPGNIAIDNQRAILLDIENSLVGGSCLYRQYLLELRKTTTMEYVDVYCYGRTLYEMTYANILNGAFCDNYDGISVELESLLRQCIPTTKCKQIVSTLDVLIEHAFFKLSCSISNGIEEQNDHMKLNTQSKTILKELSDVILKRLAGEQKIVRNRRREVKIQEILTSDEEMRKHKLKARRRSKEWWSTSSLAMSSCSSPTLTNIPENNTNSTQSYCTTPSSSNINNIQSPPQVTSKTTNPTSDARSALLDAVCNFNKQNLKRVNSR